MSLALAILSLTVATVGHVVFWVGLVNRLHAVAWHRRLIDALTALCGMMLVAVPVVVALAIWLHGFDLPSGSSPTEFWAIWLAVPAFAFIALYAAWQRWIVWNADRAGASVLANHTHLVDVRQLTDQPLTAPGVPTLLARLPGNEIVCPAFQEKLLVLPSMPADHAGIKLVHLTDLHMSGRITKAYFVEVVKKVNAGQPDIIAVTGDIVEREKCLDWIPDTLGQLRAAHGCYFILGNHDRRGNTARLRELLTDVGLLDVGSTCRDVHVGSTRVILGGNELPWFGPPADFESCPPRDATGQPLRILLAHSPDQFAWAEARDIDLMLAGHCHGGQVRFPLVGPVLAPSLHGTRYSSGVFRSGQAILHVSRGTSGLAPFRFNCPPEVSLLTLCSAPAAP